MLVKRSSMLPGNGTGLDWSRLESEVSGLTDLASAVAAFGSKVPPSAATVRRWQKLSTPALVALAQAGHRDAFDPLYRRFSARILRSALRLANGNQALAEDVASETWAWAVANIDRFDPRDGDEDGFIRWLHSVAKGARQWRFDHMLKEHPAEMVHLWGDGDQQLMSLWESGEDECADRPARVRMRAWIREVIASMPPAVQRVARLKLDGFSAADIAAQLGTTEAAVANHWLRFCNRCKETADTCPVQVERRELSNDPARLRAAAQELAPAARRVVLMRLDGLNCREIAERLGRSLGGVQNYCYQARKTFAAQGLAFK